MLESLMAIAFFVTVNLQNVEWFLSQEEWAWPADVEEAAKFLRWAETSGWQQRIARKIPKLERMILLVHRVVRVKNPGQMFARLSNSEFNRELLGQYVADLDAIRLGWPSAAYADPGLVRLGEYAEPKWVIFKYPSLSDERIKRLMSDGRTLALRDLNEPPQRFVTLLDANAPLSAQEQEKDDDSDVFV